MGGPASAVSMLMGVTCNIRARVTATIGDNRAPTIMQSSGDQELRDVEAKA